MELKIADTSAQDVAVAEVPAWRRWLVVGIVAALVVAVVAYFLPAFMRWSAAGDSISRERLRLATVTRGDLVRDVSVQGRVVAAVSPTLYAADTGTITFVVEQGDKVDAEAVLATIDSPELENRLQQEQASLDRKRVELDRQAIESKQQALANQKAVDLANLQLTAAGRESRRAIEAYEKEAISQLDYEKAQDELESAEYAHKHAVADAELYEERLQFELRTKQLEVDQQSLLVEDLVRQVDELTLRSPVSGIVGNRLVDQKTTVSKNLPVMSVVDLTRFEVEALIPESYADDLAIGMAAEIMSGSSKHVATIVSVSPEIIENQVTTRLRFESGTPPGLRQNQRLTTRVLLESKSDVLMVTRGQFLESGAGRIAYRVDDGMASKRAIRTGAYSLNAVEIVQGLSEGDTIIISSTDVFEGVDTVLITN